MAHAPLGFRANVRGGHSALRCLWHRLPISHLFANGPQGRKRERAPRTFSRLACRPEA
jgi:hypothetical protein